MSYATRMLLVWVGVAMAESVVAPSIVVAAVAVAYVVVGGQ